MAPPVLALVVLLIAGVVGTALGAIAWRIIGPRINPGCPCRWCTWPRRRV